MKKLVLMFVCAMGVFAAQAQFFVGGSLELFIDQEAGQDVGRVKIAPEFGYAINDQWTVAGAIGYSRNWYRNEFFFAPYARWTFFNKGIVGLHVDGGFGISVDASDDAGFEVGFKPGISFKVTEHFAMVGNVGFLGFRTNYLGNNKSGLSLSGNDFGVSLYYTF